MSLSPHASGRGRLSPGLDLLVGALHRQVDYFRTGHIAGEEELTSALVTTARSVLDGLVAFGVRWEATVLTRRTEEPRHGADLLFILDINLPDYAVTKGFLAQAKLIVPGQGVSDRQRLVRQCKTMLGWTNAAYVWAYSPRDGVRAYPAMSVAAADGHLADLNYMPLREFFHEHFACFLGDRALCYSERSTAEAMMGEYRVGRAVIVRARHPAPD